MNLIGQFGIGIFVVMIIFVCVLIYLGTRRIG